MILYKEEETSTDYKIIQITRHRFFRIRFRFFPQKKGEKNTHGLIQGPEGRLERGMENGNIKVR